MLAIIFSFPLKEKNKNIKHYIERNQCMNKHVVKTDEINYIKGT